MKKETKKINLTENEKLCAFLSYLYLGLIWYLVDEKIRKSNFVKYHVKQGLLLLITNLVLGAIMGIPIIGWLAAPLVSLIILGYMIIGILNVFFNRQKELPLIGRYAEKFNV